MRYQFASSALIAIEAWVLWCSGSVRAVLQTGHPQFHCGTPPPAAAPRTTTRSMIRLLEIPKLSDSKSFEGGHRNEHNPAIRNVSRLEIHLKPKRLAIAAAYLRAAHAYILISMPTGTSTIFGVFQAILALPLNRTNSVLAHKVMRNEKFASGIFCRKLLTLMLHRNRNSQ